MRNYILAAFLGLLLATLQAPKSEPVLFSKMSSKAYPGGFTITLNSNSSVPIRAGTPFTLDAYITMENGVGSFEFQWLIPEGVQIVSGEEDPTLQFGPNQSAQTKITLVIKDERYNYQIGAEAYRMHQEGVRGAVSQFNTNPSALGQTPERLPGHKRSRLLQ